MRGCHGAQSAGGGAAAGPRTMQGARAQQGGSIPVLAALGRQALSPEAASDLLDAGADGVALDYDRLNQAAAGFSGRSAADSGGSNPVRCEP